MSLSTTPRTRVVVSAGTVDTGSDAVLNADDNITFSFEVKNTGDTCLAVTSIVDDNAGEVDCPYVIDMAGEELWLDTVQNL